MHYYINLYREDFQQKIQSEDRFHWLDGLRGIAALLVVFHHCFISFDFSSMTGMREDSNHWSYLFAYFPMQPGNWGSLSVCLFFVISGFALSHAYERTRSSFIENIIKRYVRLTIPVLAGCLLGYYVYLFHLTSINSYLLGAMNHAIEGDVVQHPTFMDAIKQGLTAVHSPRAAHATYNGVVWTMPIEFSGSILILAVNYFSRRTGLRIELILSLGIALLITTYAGLFFIGAIIHFFRSQLISSGKRSKFNELMILIGFLIGAMPLVIIPPVFNAGIKSYNNKLSSIFMGHVGAFVPMQGASVVHAFGAVLLFLGVLRLARAKGLLVSRVCQWLGFVSFPLYLVHAPIIQVVFYGLLTSEIFSRLNQNFAFIIALLSTVFTSLGIAYIITILVEFPTVYMVRNIKLPSIIPLLAYRRRAT